MRVATAPQICNKIWKRFRKVSVLVADHVTLGIGIRVHGDPANPAPPTECRGFPLNPLAIAVNPADLVGSRYVFANYIGLPYKIPTAKNAYNHYTLVGKPIGGTPGGQAFNFTATLRLGDNATCSGIFSAGYFNANGEKDVLTWSAIFDITKPSRGAHKILFLDNSQQLEIWYQCYGSNTTTGICDVPYVEVTVPSNPNLLSSSERATLIQTVDKVLAPYCLSTANMLITLHDDTLPVCLGLEQPEDFVRAITLFSEVAK
ncbi:hypothetical protein BV898_16927 [Hypsibius exemplaris]|uniref:Uncharacterized protein n=1 Tax=Hypsibius exemplaris TaxID=2072580 RepID=A0A9X6RLN5_HYPEX|nr:hypothetical protein BV898_16927 [Hypsibius exemplaris]